MVSVRDLIESGEVSVANPIRAGADTIRPMNLASVLLARASTEPGATALLSEGGPVTYGELDDRSARLAGVFLARLEPGSRVGVVAPERSGIRRRLPRVVAGRDDRGAARPEPAGARADEGPRDRGRHDRRRRRGQRPPPRARRVRRGDPGRRRQVSRGRRRGVRRRSPWSATTTLPSSSSPREPPARRSPRCSPTARWPRTSRRFSAIPGSPSIPTTSGSGCCPSSTCSGSTSRSVSRSRRGRRSRSSSASIRPGRSPGCATAGVTVIAGVPAVFAAWLDLPEERAPATAFAKVRLAVSGAAALPVEVATKMHERFGVDVREGYGLTEASPIVTTAAIGGPVRPGSIGPPLPGCRGAAARRRRHRRALRRPGRDLGARPQRVRGLLGRPRGDRA